MNRLYFKIHLKLTEDHGVSKWQNLLSVFVKTNNVITRYLLYYTHNKFFLINIFLTAKNCCRTCISFMERGATAPLSPLRKRMKRFAIKKIEMLVCFCNPLGNWLWSFKFKSYGIKGLVTLSYHGKILRNNNRTVNDVLVKYFLDKIGVTRKHVFRQVL